MRQFLEKLNKIGEIAELVRCVETGACPAAMTGLQAVQRACVGAAVARATERSAVFVCGDEREARTLAADLTALTGDEAVVLPAREWNLRPGAVASREWEQQRLATLCALAEGKARVLVATAEALMARTVAPQALRERTVRLAVGERADLESIAETLVAAGYARCEQVEGAGQFAVRGGILDVFSPAAEMPVRCEF
ncbi:MAG: transcription-repair coupling factor, partial [Oscillibacter sp.]|nr:transcription-repair coupling factor [Oscillibacter sp.]